VIAAGLLLLAIAISWLLGLLWQRWLEPLVAQREEDLTSESDGQVTLSTEIGAQIIINALRLMVWLFIVIQISRLYPQTRQLDRSITDSLFTSLNADLIPLGETTYSVTDLLVLVGLFAGLIVLARSVRTILRSRILRFTGLSRAAQETVSVIFNYTFIFIGTLVVLQLWGLDISSLTVFAGVLGVGVGLGLQGIAKEFLSGLVLIFERPIQVGDFVDVGGLMGTVERISVRSTEIRTLDQVSIILPNSRFLESEVINWSHHSSISRLKIPVGVAYGSDTKAVRQTLIDAAKAHKDVLSHPSPHVFFTEFADSSLNFDLLVWITEPRKQFQIKSDLYFRIESLLNERGIEIPFPQRDLHVRSGNLPLDLSPELVHSLAQLSKSLSVWLDQQAHRD
jgi:small-conductance mechanosensitive channel